MDTPLLGKILIALGIGSILVGALLVSGRWPTFLGRLPGDIQVEKPNFNFYFPVVTCLVLSAVATAILWILSRFR